MYLQETYRFERTIINGNRITVPKDVMESNGWKKGTKILVTFEPLKKEIKGIVI